MNLLTIYIIGLAFGLIVYVLAMRDYIKTKNKSNKI